MADLKQRLGDLILGTDRKLRMRVKLTLIALYGYTVSSGVLIYGINTGIIHDRYGWWLCAYIWTGVPMFYLLVRTQWSNRLGNPSLDVAQSIYALVAILAAYVITGPLRNSVLILISLVQVVGMFTMTGRQVMQLGFFAVLGLAAVMLAMVAQSPEQFDVRFEVIKFILTASVMPALCAVAFYINQVRERLVEQRKELAHALDLLQDIASRDEMTRLVNRRHMQQRLDAECARQARTGEAFCVALLDLDNFKRINDQHGHAVGDRVLRAFSDAATEALRKTDVLARWGGEEFLLLLPDEDLASADAAVQRIRQRVAERLGSGELAPLQVTFSAGLTDHPCHEVMHETLERADHALYTAKEQGRNRTIVEPATRQPKATTPLVAIGQVCDS